MKTTQGHNLNAADMSTVQYNSIFDVITFISSQGEREPYPNPNPAKAAPYMCTCMYT